MVLSPVSILGGDSVYCINEAQMNQAKQLAEEDPESSIKIKSIKGRIEIQFKSKSFLQQQVRSMVGCLKYLGEKKWNLKKFDLVIKSKKRIFCAPPAPPEGLFLEKVIY